MLSTLLKSQWYLKHTVNAYFHIFYNMTVYCVDSYCYVYVKLESTHRNYQVIRLQRSFVQSKLHSTQTITCLFSYLVVLVFMAFRNSTMAVASYYGADYVWK